MNYRFFVSFWNHNPSFFLKLAPGEAQQVSKEPQTRTGAVTKVPRYKKINVIFFLNLLLISK